MTVFAMRCGQTLCGSIVVGVLSFGASVVQANPIVHYDISVFGGLGGPFNTNFNVAGAPTADPQKFAHTGSLLDPGFSAWRVDYNTTSDPDPSVGSASLSSGLTIENMLPDIGPGANHLQFIIAISLPVYASMPTRTFAGNAGMTLNITPGSPGILTSYQNWSIWNSYINGALSNSLYAPGFVLGGSNGPATASTNPGQTVSPFNFAPQVSSIGITVAFDLTPGETVTFNDFWAFVPSPGALALFGLAGIVGGRRRRA
jgi:hypothetical protein